jgi:phospholipase/carboxylesterase
MAPVAAAKACCGVSQRPRRTPASPCSQPDSRDATWDGIRGGFGPDVTFIDRALARVFERVPIDSERIAVGGFSDGATYALSLGLVNGDPLSPRRRLLARLHRRRHAAGKTAVLRVARQGRSEFLPIEQCSRVIVPQLQRRGYEVTFKEFDGGHQVPPTSRRRRCAG